MTQSQLDVVGRRSDGPTFRRINAIKIAYLTNAYPAVSHSFIRREILAIEAMGHPVSRWSVRRGTSELPDPEDRAELEKTAVVLERPLAVCAAAVLGVFSSPIRALRAFIAAIEGREAGLRPLIARFAHFAEGCFLARRFRAAGIDHVHVHFGTNPAAVARIARMIGGPPYSFTAHGPDEFDRPESIGLGKKVADAAFAVGISAYGKSQLMRWTPVVHWPRIAVVRCGVDSGFLSASNKSLEGLSSNHLCCVARLAPQKGLPLLIDAAAELHRSGTPFQLSIVGDGPLRTEIEAQIARHGLGHCVRLHGWADTSKVRDILHDSRAMVLPSFAEGLPVVIMEALALGRPVITTAIAGIPELVDDGCGWLIPAGSAEALVDAMRKALEASADTLQYLGEEGARRVRFYHDASANARILLDLIESAQCAVST